MSSITTQEDPAMPQETLSDPDVLVFMLTTTLSSLFALFTLFVPGGTPSL